MTEITLSPRYHSHLSPGDGTYNLQRQTLLCFDYSAVPPKKKHSETSVLTQGLYKRRVERKTKKRKELVAHLGGFTARKKKERSRVGVPIMAQWIKYP